jgi:urease accessory protein
VQEWTSSSNGSATRCFSSRPREPERVGRDGFLKLRFARCGGNTILAQSRFSLPLQALAPLTLADGSSYLMLLNPTGGVLGGDRLVTEIDLEPGTHVCLSTPSATRVYRTVGEPAILDTVIRVGEGGTLEYFPDHVIPHAGSALRQSLRLSLNRGSRAILFDSMAAGRVAHGERWVFTDIDSRIDVRVSGCPSYINRTTMIPKTMHPDRLGLVDSFDYVACMAVVADGFSRWPQLCAALNAVIETVPEIRGGATVLSRGGCMVRFLARSAPDMTITNKKLWDTARGTMLNLPPFDQRKY